MNLFKSHLYTIFNMQTGSLHIITKKDVDEYYKKEFYLPNSNFFNNSSLEVQKKQSDFFNSRWENILKKLL